MSRRLLDLRGVPGQHVRVYEDDGHSLYLGISTSPAHLVMALTAGQVDHLMTTLADWRERQSQRQPFSSEQSPRPDRGAEVAGGAPTGVNRR